MKVTIPAGEPNPGTYLVTWNGHGDALGLWKIDSGTGALTLANSFTYSTWGAPATATHNGYPDLGFRFPYVGRFDVQWDNTHGLGLLYMHARHYAPSLGRFLQADLVAAEENLYAYVENGPISRIDPAGTYNTSVDPAGRLGSVRPPVSNPPRSTAPPAPANFQKAGIKTHPEFNRNVMGRAPRGVTPQKALQTFCNGRLFRDTLTGNWIRYTSTTNIVVVTSKAANGMALTVFTANKPNPRWTPIRWRYGC